VLEDIGRDVVYALRTFRRAPLAAVTIVSTVALGLGLTTVAFTVLNALLFRVDAVPDVHEMFAVRPEGGGERQPFTRAQFDALRRETNVFTGVYAEQSQVESRVDGRTMFGTFVTGNFFHALRVQPVAGRVLTPEDDVPSGGQAVMVLSHRGWDRLFARDPGVVGRRLLVNGLAFEVVGIMPDGFRGLTVAPDDYWAPLSMLARVRHTSSDREGDVGVDIIGRLRRGMSRQAAVAQLAVWSGRQSLKPDERRRIGLVPRDGTVPQPLETVPITAPLFFAFGLILLIGCANVANLLLAKAVAGQREIGIQLSLGASRPRIVRQLLTENLLLALVAAAFGFGISRVVLDATINWLVTSLPPDIGDIRVLVPEADWRVLVFLVAGACVSTAAFALGPSLRATRVEPLRTMRGEAAGGVRSGRARNFLIGLQVSASALLLICAAVFLRSVSAAAAFDPGMRTSDTLVVQIVNEARRTALLHATMTHASLAAIAASGPDVAAVAEKDRARTAVTCKPVSADYFRVLDIPIVRGRAFAPAERASDVSLAIVSETTARALWPTADPLGQVVRLQSEKLGANEPSVRSGMFTVVGVARDVAGVRIAPFKKAVVYVPTSGSTAGTSLVARAYGDPEIARQTLLDRLTVLDPDMARQVVTVRTLARMDAYFLELAFWLTLALGGLALALTLSGLFSVLSYLVEQRGREIGVRMALGATTRDVTRMILSQSLRPVAFGLLAGSGAAAGLATLLLATPAAAGVGEIVHVGDPAAYAVSVVIIIAACSAAASIPAARAARLDPMLTLRRE
jgi:predicted permease